MALVHACRILSFFGHLFGAIVIFLLLLTSVRLWIQQRYPFKTQPTHQDWSNYRCDSVSMEWYHLAESASTLGLFSQTCSALYARAHLCSDVARVLHPEDAISLKHPVAYRHENEQKSLFTCVPLAWNASLEYGIDLDTLLNTLSNIDPLSSVEELEPGTWTLVLEANPLAVPATLTYHQLWVDGTIFLIQTDDWTRYRTWTPNSQSRKLLVLWQTMAVLGMLSSALYLFELWLLRYEKPHARAQCFPIALGEMILLFVYVFPFHLFFEMILLTTAGWWLAWIGCAVLVKNNETKYFELVKEEWIKRYQYQCFGHLSETEAMSADSYKEEEKGERQTLLQL